MLSEDHDRDQLQRDLAAAITAESARVCGKHPGLLVEYVVVAAFEPIEDPDCTGYTLLSRWPVRMHHQLGLLHHGIAMHHSQDIGPIHGDYDAND